MKNLLEFILIHIVNFPDDVKVEETQDGEEMVYTITVNPEDLGRVIGKHGNIIQSIRSIAKVRAMKEHTRIRVIVNENDVGVTEVATESTPAVEV